MLTNQIIITNLEVFHHQHNCHFLIIMNLIQQFSIKKLKQLNLSNMFNFIILLQISKKYQKQLFSNYQSWLFATQKYFLDLLFFHTGLSTRNKLIWRIDKEMQFIYHSLKLNISDIHLKHLHIASYYLRLSDISFKKLLTFGYSIRKTKNSD
jgi:hypothetical protein